MFGYLICVDSQHLFCHLGTFSWVKSVLSSENEVSRAKSQPCTDRRIQKLFDRYIAEVVSSLLLAPKWIKKNENIQNMKAVQVCKGFDSKVR